MIADVPNAFAQTDIRIKTKGERMIIIMKGILVNTLCKLSPETFSEYVTYENDNQPYMSIC